MADAVQFYDAPPIVEAVIELRFRDQIDFNELKKLSRKLARDYPNESVEILRGLQVDFATKAVSFVDEAQHIRRSGQDEVDLAILKPEAFSFSRLAPYAGWEAFESQVSTNLSALMKGRKRVVERLGVRYINRIDIPTEADRAYHEDYFNVYIHLPGEFESISNYGLKFETDFEQHRLIVQSARTDAPVPNTCAFILDIDLIAVEDVPQEPEGIIGQLRKMRQLKNRVFESLITPGARELFKRA